MEDLKSKELSNNTQTTGQNVQKDKKETLTSETPNQTSRFLGKNFFK